MTIQIASPLEPSDARQIVKGLVEALGWNPADVIGIELTGTAIHVKLTDRRVYSLSTKRGYTSEWKMTKSAPYSHASELPR